MNHLHPQFINDHTGKKAMVVLPVKEYEQMLEYLEELEDIRLYDQAKREDSEEPVLFADYLKQRNG